MNWAKYKLTFTKIQNLKITTAQTIQGLQQIHQQLQQIHQAFDGSHSSTIRVESTATTCSPSADIKFWESLPYHGTPGDLGIISYDKSFIRRTQSQLVTFRSNCSTNAASNVAKLLRQPVYIWTKRSRKRNIHL